MCRGGGGTVCLCRWRQWLRCVAAARAEPGSPLATLTQLPFPPCRRPPAVSLPVPMQAMFMFAQLVFGNQSARLFTFVYLSVIHLLVFMLLLRMTHHSSNQLYEHQQVPCGLYMLYMRGRGPWPLWLCALACLSAHMHAHMHTEAACACQPGMPHVPMSAAASARGSATVAVALPLRFP